MTRIRKISSSLLLLSFVTTGLWGCAQGNTPGAQQGQQGQQGAHVQSVEPRATASVAESAGVVVRDDVALLLDKMSGIQNATVLMHNGNAYVGVTHIGTEHTPDAALKAGDTWRGNPWVTQQNPKSAQGMTVHELAKEGIPDGSAIQGPWTSLTGN